LLFGLGGDPGAEWMEVSWPSGLKQRFDGPKAGESLLLVESEKAPRHIQERRFTLPDPLTTAEQRFAALLLEPQQHLPGLSVLQTDGTRQPLAKVLTPGRPVLLNFWATWCQPCAAEMSALQKLVLPADPDGLRVVGISVDQAGTRDRIPAFLERVGVTYPIYIMEPQELAKLFARPDVGIPLSLLLDKELRLVDVFHGWSAESRQRLDRLTGQAHSH
jgi:thiol-disulfide isomerase/thioredoxin